MKEEITVFVEGDDTVAEFSYVTDSAETAMDMAESEFWEEYREPITTVEVSE
jgi:hypothetical protein